MKFPVTITAIRQETPTIKSFILDYGEQAFDYLPGQWIDLYLDIDGETEVAGYSITSAPATVPGLAPGDTPRVAAEAGAEAASGAFRDRAGSGQIQLAIKFGAHHRVTRYLHERARVGEKVTISNGSGNFYYRREMGERVVLIGAGVGVTPLLGILRYIHACHREVQVTLLYSVAVPGEILFAPELRAMAASNPNVRLLISVTQPVDTASVTAGPPLLTGRIDADKLRQAGLAEETLYYICGPNDMVDNTAAQLAALGIPEAGIIYEKWW